MQNASRVRDLERRDHWIHDRLQVAEREDVAFLCRGVEARLEVGAVEQLHDQVQRAVFSPNLVVGAHRGRARQHREGVHFAQHAVAPSRVGFCGGNDLTATRRQCAVDAAVDVACRLDRAGSRAVATATSSPDRSRAGVCGKGCQGQDAQESRQAIKWAHRLVSGRLGTRRCGRGVQANGARRRERGRCSGDGGGGMRSGRCGRVSLGTRATVVRRHPGFRVSRRLRSSQLRRGLREGRSRQPRLRGRNGRGHRLLPRASGGRLRKLPIYADTDLFTAGRGARPVRRPVCGIRGMSETRPALKTPPRTRCSAR